MARKSKASDTTDDLDFDFDFGDPFSEDSPDSQVGRHYSAEELDRKLRREQHQEAALLAQDGGFVTEVIGTPVELAAIERTARKRLALFSRDRKARDHLFEEFAADHDDGPIVFLPAEAVLESERLLEALHKAVCAREGLPTTMPVEDLITLLELAGPDVET